MLYCIQLLLWLDNLDNSDTQYCSNETTWNVVHFCAFGPQEVNCLSSHSVIIQWNLLASDLWLFHFLSQEMRQVCFLVPAEDALCLCDSCPWKTIWNRKQSLYNIILYRLSLQIIHQLVPSDIPRMLMLLSTTAVEHSLPSAEIRQCWYSEQWTTLLLMRYCWNISIYW